MVRISVIGLGAMGASYAAKLHDAPDTDVRVIAAGTRAASLRHEGVTVNGKHHDFTIVAPNDCVEPADLLIVAVKHMALAEALPQISRHISNHTVVISLLNGITSEAQIAEAYPRSHPLLSITFGIDAVRHGHEVSYSSLGKIAFGEANNGTPYTSQTQWLAHLFGTAGLAYEIPADMVRQLWWKFLVNAGVNQVTGVLEAPYSIVQNPGSPARDLMIAAQREVVAVARHQGVELDESDIDSWLDVLDQLGPGQYTSMAQDTLAHRPCETDIFGGMVHRIGRQAGIPTPVNTSLWALLRAKELL